MRPTPAYYAAQSRPPERLWTAGCLGLFLGIILGSCGLLAVAWMLLSEGALPSLPADQDFADMKIIVQEAYFSQMMARSMPKLPSGLASDFTLDLKPGNRLLFKGRLESTMFGAKLGGDVSGTILLSLKNGQLEVRFGDINVMGFSLPEIGTTLANELTAGMTQMIDDRMRAGLGQDVRLVDLATDERQMILSARIGP